MSCCGVVRRRILLWRKLWIPKWRSIWGFRRFNWVLRRWCWRIFDGGRLGISRLRQGIGWSWVLHKTPHSERTPGERPALDGAKAPQLDCQNCCSMLACSCCTTMHDQALTRRRHPPPMQRARLLRAAGALYTDFLSGSGSPHAAKRAWLCRRSEASFSQVWASWANCSWVRGSLAKFAQSRRI
jgi:hypothetical protein